jgi:hypothetical protein
MSDTTQARVEGTLDPLLGSDGLPWPQTFDGQTWAREFVRHVKALPEIATDEATMIGWFANAIMVGYDRPSKSPTPRVSFGAKRRKLTRLFASELKGERSWTKKR